MTRRIRRCVVLAAALALAPALASAQSAPPKQKAAATRSTTQGVFTKAQAERGEKIRDRSCSACHSPKEWARAGFLDGWAGRSAHDLFDQLRNTMPFDMPGSLSRQEYADLVAYILSLNGVPAGARELGSTDADLRKILIERPKK